MMIGRFLLGLALVNRNCGEITVLCCAKTPAPANPARGYGEFAAPPDNVRGTVTKPPRELM